MSDRPPFAPLQWPGHPMMLSRWLRDATGRLVRFRLPGNRGERQRLTRLLEFGFLWAMICTAVEVPNLQDGSVSGVTIIPVTLQVMSDFLLIGVCLSIAIFWATTGRGGWLRLACAVLAASAVGAATVAFVTSSWWTSVFNDLPQSTVFTRNRNHALEFALFAFHGWLALVYGGFAAILYGLARRIDQMTTALRSATLARERNEAAIAEARVRALVERIEPDFLLEVMQAAREHYRTDVSRGESIVNGCVLFLRTAMPQIRSRHSNLAAELDLADAFLTLRSLMGSKAMAWRIERSDLAFAAGGAYRIPLPPLVLLPVLERLIAALADSRIAGPLVIREVRGAESAELAGIDIEVDATADGHADPIEADCLDAINQRLLATSGPAAKITIERSRARRLVYRLHCPIPANARTSPPITEQFPRMTQPGEAA
jgi:hypothetical protein